MVLCCPEIRGRRQNTMPQERKRKWKWDVWTGWKECGSDKNHMEINLIMREGKSYDAL
jgi:hypothetical protein